MFWKKQQSIINKIKALLESIDKCRDIFNNTIEKLIIEGPTKENHERALRVHDAEARIDDIVREIETDMYQHALIPESRGDILGILESLDKIPNNFQSLCFQMSLEGIIVPKELHEKFLRLLEINLEAYDVLKKTILDLFYERDIQKGIDKIDRWESKSDIIERELIKEIFDSAMDKADKILLKEIVINIGDISDYAESTSDRLRIAIIKRRM